MANGWDGADPVQFDDGVGTTYELGVAVTVNADITITGVRVWHGASSNTVANRSARFWNTGGAEFESVLLDDVLAPGWTTFDLDAPLERTAGSQFVLSYGTRQFYGAVAGGFPNDSADAAVTFTQGRLDDSIATYPADTSASFYGIDIVYELGIGGNVPPVVELAVTVDGLDADATVTVEDEAPGSVTYLFDWGDGQTTATSSTSASHTYATHGLYAVLVVATDAAGAKGYDAVPIVTVEPGDGIDVDGVMRELAARLRDTLGGVTVYDHPPKKVASTPCVIVSYPSTIQFDAGGRRSRDTMIVGIVVVVARLVDRVAHTELGGYTSGFGATSVKAILESGVYSTIAGLIVQSGEFDVITIGGTEYLSAVLTLDVKG